MPVTDSKSEDFESNLQNTVGSGARLDYILAMIREGFKNGELTAVKSYVERAEKELSKGGDWERKNKLTVYKGLVAVTSRDFHSAATHFVSSLATFSPCDLLSFKDFVFYTIVTSLVALDRDTLRAKVLESPEILSVVGEIPHLKELIVALYDCRYFDWSVHMADAIDHIRTDPFLGVHCRFITRSLRLVAYRQFLLPFKSVTIDVMAQAFGVTPGYIEEELSVFISAGKLNCKIDRVHHFVENNRLEDPRNLLYSRVIKSGDSLLNRIQKLSRVIDV